MVDPEKILSEKYKEWAELETLVKKAESGMRYLSGDEVARMVKLYRKASADLAHQSGLSANPEMAGWLNALVTRVYSLLYRAPRRPFWETIQRALWIAADTVRRRKNPILLATGLFFAFAMLGALLVATQPAARELMVPAGFESSFEAWKSGKHEARNAETAIAATGGYALNNPLVALRSNAFAVASAGITGVFDLWTNGSLLGVLAYEVALAGHLPFLLISIFPHGVSEIGGIFIAVGAGFTVGGAIIRPGRKKRTLAVREVGRDAGVLFLLSLIMIFAAAPIEGFFSFNPAVPQIFKFIFGAVALTGWLSYFISYGKGGPPPGSTLEEVRPPISPD